CGITPPLPKALSCLARTATRTEKCLPLGRSTRRADAGFRNRTAIQRQLSFVRPERFGHVLLPQVSQLSSSTHHFQLPTPNSQLSTSNSQLPTLNFQLSTSNAHARACALRRAVESRGPEPRSRVPIPSPDTSRVKPVCDRLGHVGKTENDEIDALFQLSPPEFVA